MRSGGALYPLLEDHLGSTAYTLSAASGPSGHPGEVRYKAFGAGARWARFTSGTTPTTFRYTGQREEAGLGLYYYGARWYDPALGHFIQPDTIIPQPGNVLDYHRYSYTRFNPLKYTDPSGHEPKKSCCITGGPSLAPKVLQLIVDLAEVVWDGTSSERSTAGEALDVALHHPLFGPSVDEIAAAHEHWVETYVDPHLPERVKETRDTANEILNTSGVGDVLLATIRVPPLGRGGAAADDLVRIVERDGDIVEIVAKGKNGDITAIARMHKEGDQLILSGLHIDGPGPGGSSIEELMNIGRTLGRQEGANEVVVYRARRTTGANPGRVPRPIRIKVE